MFQSRSRPTGAIAAAIAVIALLVVGFLYVTRAGADSPATLKVSTACSPLTQSQSAPVGSSQTCRVRVKNLGPDTAINVTVSQVSPFPLVWSETRKYNPYNGSYVVVAGLVDLAPNEYLLTFFYRTRISVPDAPGPTNGCGSASNAATVCAREQATLP